MWISASILVNGDDPAPADPHANPSKLARDPALALAANDNLQVRVEVVHNGVDNGTGLVVRANPNDPSAREQSRLAQSGRRADDNHDRVRSAITDRSAPLVAVVGRKDDHVSARDRILRPRAEINHPGATHQTSPSFWTASRSSRSSPTVMSSFD